MVDADLQDLQQQSQGMHLKRESSREPAHAVLVR
jgi:hypothetical protein